MAITLEHVVVVLVLCSVSADALYFGSFYLQRGIRDLTDMARTSRFPASRTSVWEWETRTDTLWH